MFGEFFISRCCLPLLPALPAAFTQPWTHLLAEPCTSISFSRQFIIVAIEVPVDQDIMSYCWVEKNLSLVGWSHGNACCQEIWMRQPRMSRLRNIQMFYPSRASEASEAWVSEMRKMSGEEMCMWEDGGLNSRGQSVCLCVRWDSISSQLLGPRSRIFSAYVGVICGSA